MTTADVPLGATKIGCRGHCRVLDREHNPQLGLVYCAQCPVTIRRLKTGRWRFDLATRELRKL